LAGKTILDPILGTLYNSLMRIISRKTLKDFWEHHADSRQSLQSWYTDTKKADWKGPADIKNYYRNASFLPNNRIVFNIKGNKYRLVVAINYSFGIVYIHFVGTHQEYDKIDAATI
jgi:mRNA interferase HigB